MRVLQTGSVRSRRRRTRPVERRGERVEAARRAEAAALAESMARKEEREIAEAHASAQRQAKSYIDAESRRRALAGPQPVPIGLASDPYEQHQVTEAEMEAFQAQRMANPGGPEDAVKMSSRPREEARRASREIRPYSGERRGYRPELEARRRPQGYRPDEVSGVWAAHHAPAAEPRRPPVRTRISSAVEGFARMTPPYQPQDRMPASSAQMSIARNDAAAAQQRQMDRDLSGEPDVAPAWLYGSGGPAVQRTSLAADTLQYSRERVASRWFALKGVFEPGQDAGREGAPSGKKEMRTAPLAVFSLAGGVGKTSLVATLGRALSSLGEKVLLADTTSHGLLPYYFGASELRPGVVRTFSPPSGSTDAPIHLVSYDVDKAADDKKRQGVVLEELGRSTAGSDRLLLDLNANSGWMVRRLAGMAPTVLVPVAPDMNSVISLQTVERYFQDMVDLEGHALRPHYVLNQFDASLPLHLDVREVLRSQLGDRLLPFVVRRAPAVSEALAEGMTVVDYAPEGLGGRGLQKHRGVVAEHVSLHSAEPSQQPME